MLARLHRSSSSLLGSSQGVLPLICSGCELGWNPLATFRRSEEPGTTSHNTTAATLFTQPHKAYSSGKSTTHATTVLSVRKDGEVVLIADGQVTMGAAVVKPNVKKTRRIGEHAIGGFAGATADAFTLFERLETKLEEHPGQLTRAAVELAKMWRMDKYLRRLDAALILADRTQSLQITGSGDVLEPHDGIIAIGSGTPYALAAARALIDIDGLNAVTIAHKAMKIAADACIYTNANFSALHIDAEGKISDLDLPTEDMEAKP